MANLFARATANWASANWNTQADGGGAGATPGASDVCMANGFTVTVNTNVTVSEVRNDTTGGATDGGGFSLSNGVTLTANIYTGAAVNCVTTANNSTTNIVGNVFAGSGSSSSAVVPGSPSTLTITGNVTGGSVAAARGVSNPNNASCIANITGNALGGTAGSGAHNSGSGTVNITGNAIAHATGAGAGASNQAGGTLIISGYAQANDYGPGSAGITAANGASNVAQGVLEIGEARAGARGLGAVSGAFRYASTTSAKSTVRATSGLTELVLRPIAAVVPATTDVKAGVVYGDSGYTGTLVSSSGNSMAGHFS